MTSNIGHFRLFLAHRRRGRSLATPYGHVVLVQDEARKMELLRVAAGDSSVRNIEADRDRARSALERIKGQSPAARIDRAKIERFGSLMRENIISGDVPFRKAYLRS